MRELVCSQNNRNHALINFVDEDDERFSFGNKQQLLFCGAHYFFMDLFTQYVLH